jgi:hypothetical protein
MTTYKIPIVWQSIKFYEVEAENLQDAVEQALQTFLSEPDENYLEGSFEIDGIVEENYPNETYNIDLVV